MLGPINSGINACFLNSVIQVLYCLPLFREYIRKIQPSIKGVAMKIRKLFREVETSDEPVKDIKLCEVFKYTSLWTGMKYDAHECLLQLLAKIYSIINDDCTFKIDKRESILCNDCGLTANNDGVCINFLLHQGFK